MALHVFFIVLSVVILSYPFYKLSKTITNDKSKTSQLCQLTTQLNMNALNKTYESSNQTLSRVIVIGDVHGSYSGLLTILHKAGIVSDPKICAWDQEHVNSNPVTIIQIGDIVDRGPGASESWSCLSSLQATQGQENQVIRMIGSKSDTLPVLIIQ
jgi:hypothetical protein